jgi:Tol biopolymer transport system component
VVAFTSSAFDLVADDTNGVSDVFLRDLTAGTTTRMSISFTGGDADLASSEPALSGDGRFVAFSSVATNLVVGDTNNVSDVFLRDRVVGTTTRVSVSTTGGEANGPSTGPSVSHNGRIISFLSTATNLVTGAPVPAQLYTRDVQAQTTSRPMNATSAVIWGRLSGDGRYVTEFGSSGVTVADRVAGTGVLLSNSNFTVFWPVLSGNGRYLVLLNGTGGNSVTVFVMPNPL